MATLQPGHPAPDFTLADQEKKKHTLSSYRGRPVVLLFYPLDFSSVCSEEHACMVRAMDRFNSLDAQVFGISVDSTHSHRVFAAQQGVQYPLLADFHPRGAVAEQYGFFLPDYGYSSRAVVIIDREGNIAEAYETGMGTVPDVERIAESVGKL
jgi:peroxiredoxin